MLRHLYGWAQIVLYGALVVCFVLAVFTPTDGFAVHQAIDAASFAVFEILLALKMAFLRIEHKLKLVSLVFTAIVGLGVLTDSMCTNLVSSCDPGFAVFIPNFTSFAMAPAISLGWLAGLDLLGALKSWSKPSLYIFGALFCSFLVRSAFAAAEATSVAVMVAIWVLMALVVANLIASQIDFDHVV